MKLIFARRRARRGLRNVGIVVFVLGVGLSLAQTGDSPAHKNKKAAYAALAEAPEKARERKNPFAGEPQAVAAGGKLFEQHCAECHGAKAGGTRYGVSLLREEVQQATPGTLFWILTNGVVRRSMPVWSKLPEAERWQIVTFLRSLNTPSMNPQSPMLGQQPVRLQQQDPALR